jgi:NADP-dependent 3-hydroxy acid dehydrogenase YdfG
MKNLNGKVAAITGAGSGIGRATAIALCAEGAKLALSDKDIVGLGETANLVQQAGGEVITHILDVTDSAAVDQWAADAIAHYGDVDIIMNNAGVALVVESHDQSHEELAWVMDINFWGVVHGTRAFLPHMRERGSGHIVNIASMAGLSGLPAQSAYCASKFAVRGYSESVCADLAGTGVGVSIIMPGGVATNIIKSSKIRVAGEDTAAAESLRETFDGFLRTSPEKAASLIIKAIKRNRMKQLVGGDARILDIVQRLIPGRFARLTGAGASRLR